MQKGTPPDVSFRRRKWLIEGFLILSITLGELYHYFLEENLVTQTIIWAIGVSIAIITIELIFRQTFRLMEASDRQLEESHLQDSRLAALLAFSARMNGSLDETEVCRIVEAELAPALGLPAFRVILDADGDTKEADGQRAWPVVPSEIQTNIDTGILRSPIIYRDKRFGSLIATVAPDTPGRANLQGLLQTTANQIAVAIHVARQYDNQHSQRAEAEAREIELRVRERYLVLLNEITRATLKSQDLQTTLQTLADYLGRMFEADSSLITLWDENRNMSVPAAAYGPLRQVVRTLQIEPGDLPLTASVLESGRGLVIEDTRNSPYISARISGPLQSRSLLALPLISDDQKLGAAILAYQQKHSFLRHEVSLGEQAASQIALAIAKARALEAAQSRAQELSALQTATAALLNTLNVETLLGEILDAAISAIPVADKGTLHLVARDTGQLQIRAIQGYTDPRIRIFNPTDVTSYAALAARERNPLLISDVHSDATRTQIDIPELRAIASTIVAPLVRGSETLGAISLDAYHRYAFSKDDLDLLVSFAATATAAIDNAQLHAEVQKQAVTDSLTGLYNRRSFFELGHREIERSQRFERSLSAMMVDIDHFKEVNDNYGHLAGDKILAGVAKRIENHLRQVDLLARYGGDEFVALLPETELKQAVLAADRLRAEIATAIFSTGQSPLGVTVSIGVATLESSDEKLESLILRADNALYAAKEAGRDKVTTGD